MYITNISPTYTKISTKASPCRNLLPSRGGGCKDYQGIKTGGWKFSGAGCVSQQNYWCSRNVQREVLKFAISNVQSVVAVATQLACSIWIIYIHIIITIWTMTIIMIYVSKMLIRSQSYTAHLFRCIVQPGSDFCLNPAPLEVNGACPGADAPLFGAVAAFLEFRWDSAVLLSGKP